MSKPADCNYVEQYAIAKRLEREAAIKGDVQEASAHSANAQFWADMAGMSEPEMSRILEKKEAA